MRKKWAKNAVAVIDSGNYVNGSNKKLFESLWAKKLSVSFATGVGNGLDGLILALRALNLNNGQVVAVPAHTFIATWIAVRQAGAVPYGLDVDSNGLIDLDKLEGVQDKISAVIPVHMHGKMVDMERISTWAAKNKVFVIEDASQSHLAKFRDRYAGSWGDIGVFSLYPTKNLGALGDAGVVVTNSLSYKEKIDSLSNYGFALKDKYNQKSLGINSRLDEIQAAFLISNLDNLAEWNKVREEIAEKYISGISHSEIRPLNYEIEESNVWHHFPVICERRDELKKYLDTKSIETVIHYPTSSATIYGQSENFYNSEDKFKNSEFISRNILSLPISPWHKSKQINKVIKALNEF